MVVYIYIYIYFWYILYQVQIYIYIYTTSLLNIFLKEKRHKFNNTLKFGNFAKEPQRENKIKNLAIH